MKRWIGTLTILMLSLAAGEASARTFSLGVLPTGTTVVGDANRAGGFSDTFNFRLSGLSDVLVSFASAAGVTSLEGMLQEKTSSGWAQVGDIFSASTSFSGDLAAGRYRLDVVGFVPKSFGLYTANINVAVAAVPEADTWLMFLVGAGLIAYQLRRKQKSLPRQSIATR